MQSTSLICLTVVLIVAFYSLPISAKPTKTPSDAAATTTTTTVATKAKAVGKTTGKPSAAKTTSETAKQQNEKVSKKPKKSIWLVPNAVQKKLFNDYKAILRKKLIARHQNVSATYQLEPAKYGSQVDANVILHHYLIKLPDAKYAHAIIGTKKNEKKPSVNENHASIRRTVYESLAAAEE